jgi:hypothetical protein
MTRKPGIRITLTPEQQAKIQQATGKAVTTLKLQPLEERITPTLSTN